MSGIGGSGATGSGTGLVREKRLVFDHSVCNEVPNIGIT